MSKFRRTSQSVQSLPQVDEQMRLTERPNAMRSSVVDTYIKSVLDE